MNYMQAFEQQVFEAGAPPEQEQREPRPADFIMSAEEFCRRDFPKRQYHLTPIIPEMGIVLLPGWRGTGKTWLALSILDAVSRGTGLGPWSAGKAAPCLYVDAELPPGDLKERLTAINPNHNRRAPFFIYNDCEMTSHGVRRASFLDEAWRQLMKEMLMDLSVKLVCFDNISSLSPGIDENSKQSWDVINQWLLELRFAGICSLLPHHTGKGGAQRGTSGREDNVDLTLMLKHPPNYSPEMGCDFIATVEKARVPAEHLSALADVRMTLVSNSDGTVEWRWGNAKGEMKKVILEMLRSGASYDEIVEATGVTKGYISRIKKEAVTDGLLSKN